MVGAVYIEDDSGTDLRGDTFYVAFQGGSSTTTLSRVIIDGKQNGNPNQLGEPDVYFDTDAANNGQDGLGAGGASPFLFDSRSIGVTADQIKVSVVDGGTRIILDIEDFRAGDVLVFTIDVDQYFSNKPDDQVVSGIEFTGSSLSTVFQDPHYNFASATNPTNGVFQYDFAFGSDDVADTGLLSMLPSKEFRDASNGLASIENRTSGALEAINLTPKPISISGTVWHDRDLDLQRDLNEEGIAGTTLRLQMKNDQGQYVDVIRNGSAVTTTTDANGKYSFGTNLGLMPGTYRVVENQPTDFEFSVGAVTGTVAGSSVGSVVNENVLGEIVIPLGDQHAINYDFGEARAAKLCGFVYHDRDDDGIRDAGEEGLAGVEILITPIRSIGNQGAITVFTDSNGRYCVDGLAPGEYTVRQVVQPSGYVDGKDTAGNVDGTPVGTVVPPGDRITGIVLNSGAHGQEYNFGELQRGSLSGHVGISTPDGNCVRFGDPGYRPIPGVTIQLFDQQGTLIASTTTGADGGYTFGDLPPGTYTIVQVTPPSFPYLQGGVFVGLVDGAASGSVSAKDTISQIVVGPGDHGVKYDFCEKEPASISGYVYHDLDDDGNFEQGEPPIAGTRIELFDINGQKVAETITDGSGYYSFQNLYAGTYRIVETQPTGFTDGKDSLGTIAGVATGVVGNDQFASIAILGAQTGVNYNFGEIKLASISGMVKTDLNGNCVYEPGIGERPISGVLIELRDSQGNVVATTRTDASGMYRFEGLRPGTYSVFENHPNGYFQGGQKIGTLQGTTTKGPGSVLGTDLLGGIAITSGMQLVGYNFCEEPPASLSGYVFQDGAAVVSLDGKGFTPQQLASMRDGRFTPDDTPLAGVVLELRDGITGEPIMGSHATPGTYGSGPIRTTTDSRGFYIFTGLPAGNYAVFQVQPNGYLDHLDTPGTTLGVAINPSQGIDPSVLSTLSSGIDPKNDAILRIAVGVGQQSQLNNFSEVRVSTLPPPPPELPKNPLPPTIGPNPYLPDNPLGLYGQLPAGLRDLPRFGFDVTSENTWHLSVINGGVPRGNDDPTINTDERWNSASFLSRQQWLATNMNEGEWELGRSDGEGNRTADSRKVTFGSSTGIPVSGDFNGDGRDELAIFDAGRWYVDLNGNGRWDQEDLWAELGDAADRPVTGDWDGDGKDDIGIFGPIWPKDAEAIAADPGLPDADNRRLDFTRVEDPKNLPPRPEEATSGVRSLKLTADGREREDVIDHVFAYGSGGDIPITGDWNGDGIRTIGVFREGEWRLDLDGDGRFTSADGTFRFGQAGDLPVIGDWNGDGVEEIGVFRGGTWIIDTDGDRELTATDKVFEMGGEGDLPVTGDWDGDGIDDPGLYRARPDSTGQRRAG